MYKIYADTTLFFDDELQSQPELQLLAVKLTQEVNKAGCLEFTVPTHNAAYSLLQKLKTTVVVIYEDSPYIYWEGRVLHDEKDFYNRKKVYCEGALSYLTDAILRPYDWAGSLQQYFQYMVNQQRDSVEEDRKIRYGSGDLEDPNSYIVRSNSQYVSVWDEISTKILKRIGGYLKLTLGIFGGDRRKYLHLDSSAGSTSDQVIRFGENLLDIDEYITAENVFTVLIPLGAREENLDGSQGPRLTIEDVNSGLDYVEDATAIALFGRIVRTAEWDDVTVASNLKAKGEAYLAENLAMSVTLTIKAVDLHYLDVSTEKIEVGTQVRVVSEPHGLDAYFQCTKVVTDLQNPDRTEFTLGAGFSALTDQQVAAAKMTNSAFETAESASSAVSNMSTTISGNYVSRSEYTTYQTAVNVALTDAMHYKAAVTAVTDLPSSGNAVGDVRNVTATGADYAWTGSAWDKLSEDTVYATKTEFDALAARVTALENS